MALPLPEFLRSLGKQDIKPGGAYATRTALSRLGPMSQQRLLVAGPGAWQTAIYTALMFRVQATALLASEADLRPCDDAQLARRLAAKVGVVTALPFEAQAFDAALVEAELSCLEPAKQAQALLEIRRVLKPQARIALHELAWRQAPTPAVDGRLREIWGAPVWPRVTRGWWDALEAAGFEAVQSELAVVSYFTRKGLETDEGENALQVLHGAFESEEALQRFAAAYREFQVNRRYYGVIIATARKAG
ncbi:methyltransferase domain-containing protein [bacterium]|nr:MAG: methyltransferase domain-containing protein [bacterium]RIK62944.1 MAG: hypothetical protein DCC64_08975 [Planctomycetota bacterium]